MNSERKFDLVILGWIIHDWNDIDSINIRFMSTLGYKKSYCWVLKGNPTIKFYEKTGATYSGLSKTDDIGGKKFEEIAYEWASISLNNGADNFDPYDGKIY